MISSGDEFSAGRAEEFEASLMRKTDDYLGKKEEKKGGGNDGFSIQVVPRARRIHQSLLSTPLSSLRCLYACLVLLYNHPNGYPDLILTNGPATSLILILASTIIRFFAFMPIVMKAGTVEKMRTIYIESWARVKRPSMSGRIIVYCGLCNRVLVQWKGLETRGWGEYRGPLVR